MADSIPTGGQTLSDREILELMPQEFRNDLAEVCRLASERGCTVKVAGVLRNCLNYGALTHCRAAIAAALATQPPAPAPDTPLDLDGLLSPKGAYEPGTGQEDGAQLLTDPHGGNPQWWRPLYGCDSLDLLLDEIRARILPHLRPPIAGIDVPGGDGDYGGLQELCEAEGVDVRIGAPLLKRARKAWKVAAQPPAPVPASDGEREELAQWLERHHQYANELGRPDWGRMSARAATLLRQPAPAPAAAPVVVAERPWEREGWLHPEEGWCWFGEPETEYSLGETGDYDVTEPQWVRWVPPSNLGPFELQCVSLPHWAIPIPQPPQGGEVEDA